MLHIIWKFLTTVFPEAGHLMLDTIYHLNTEQVATVRNLIKSDAATFLSFYLAVKELKNYDMANTHNELCEAFCWINLFKPKTNSFKITIDLINPGKTLFWNFSLKVLGYSIIFSKKFQTWFRGNFKNLIWFFFFVIVFHK